MPTPLNSRDLAFILYDWLKVDSLTQAEVYADHSRETFDDALELAERLAVTYFQPALKTVDTEEPFVGPAGHVVLPEATATALAEFAKSGLIAARFDPELGGVGLPNVITYACMAWFQAANIGIAGYPFLSIANANLLITHGTEHQIDTWVRPMLDGRFTGTMCLSEPGAGSSLADITTRATPAADGTHRIIGSKMWISGGDHELSENIVHLVLAKTPGGPPGVKGISLFIVPKFLEDGSRNDVALVGLNHKMGYRGTTNTLLSFGDGTYDTGQGAGAIGYLVGDEFQGLAYML